MGRFIQGILYDMSLNMPLLGRKIALKKFQQMLHRYKDEKSLKNFLRKMQWKYEEKQDYMDPYVGILRWYIAKKLKSYKIT